MQCALRGKVTEEDYADLVTDAREYLSGASRKVQDQLAKDMESRRKTCSLNVRPSCVIDCAP